MNVYKYAKDDNLLLHSAVKDKEFREFFEHVKIKTAVEIGTYQGISAAYLAKFAKNVFTFDVVNYRKKYTVWKDLGVEERIQYKTIKNRDDIREVLNRIKWDFAFVDGRHTYEDVKADFEMVKSCGKVLFHDVAKRKKYGFRDFVKEIGAKIEGNIAYWQG
jgi:predicted O-methyltransferase YrrM